MAAAEVPTPLPKIWRNLFLVELPLVAGTVGYWLLSPLDYLQRTLGPSADATAAPLLYQYAGVVFTMIFWFYARLLLRPTVHLPTFRLYQEALLLGDVWVVAVSAWLLSQGVGEAATTFGALGMATFWGAVRVVFLARVGR